MHKHGQATGEPIDDLLAEVKALENFMVDTTVTRETLKNIGISSGSGMNVYWTEYAKN
jgi:hypothetical protein